ncbi:hypothetical protein [Flavobacterium acetivorans]|uniref:hypothetical protein n=1 Tax=Flavobacterium acetivorans TaxID=2893883 RepID=UPI001E5FA6FF|nr:hypothetical protein [Flavobacterium sp. F-29]UFH34611.1 hypothetical protein LNP19_10970 [Flavobacterium sp. F-29]
MKSVIAFTRYFGLFVFLVGVILNFKMYYFDEWPTYMFYILSFFGILLIGISYLMKRKL